VPPIPTGVLPVSIMANLPAHRIGLLAAGVEFHAPARPPHRVRAVTEAVELKPPGDAATLRLKLSPAEPAAYIYTTAAPCHRP
jgi:acyl dehydratase